MQEENADFLQQCLNQAAGEVFSTMTGIIPVAKPVAELDQSGEITGAMMVVGQYNALLSLSIDRKSSALAISLMTGMAQEELTEAELYDGIMELVNMIAGRTKALLAGTGYHYEITPPFTIVGKQHCLVFKRQVRQIGLNLDLAGAQIQLKLSFL